MIRMRRELIIIFILLAFIPMNINTNGKEITMDATDCDNWGENHHLELLCELKYHERLVLTIYNDDEFVNISGNLVEVLGKVGSQYAIDGPYSDNETSNITLPGDNEIITHYNWEFREQEMGLELITHYNTSQYGLYQEEVQISYSYYVYDEMGNIRKEVYRFAKEPAIQEEDPETEQEKDPETEQENVENTSLDALGLCLFFLSIPTIGLVIALIIIITKKIRKIN